MPPTDTYTTIPPPPLPQFYLHQKTGRDGAIPRLNLSSCINTGVTGNRTFQPRSMKVYHATERSFVAGEQLKVQGSHPQAEAVQWAPQQIYGKTPPLAVYHICRICQRPRSARYHHEHPVPLNGMPPPPGICRRCRLTPVEEPKDSIEVAERLESNSIKLGLGCLVPERDYFTRSEVGARQAMDVLCPMAWTELEPVSRSVENKDIHSKAATEIVYRHVQTSIPPKPLVQLTPMVPVVPKRIAKNAKQSTQSSAQASSLPRDIFDASSSGKAKFTESGNPHQASNPPKLASSSPHALTTCTIVRPEYTELKIRELARDEVERYRSAERKLEAHRDPYAHGELLPVERVRVERIVDSHQDGMKAKAQQAKAISPSQHLASSEHKDTWTYEDDRDLVKRKDGLGSGDNRTTNPILEPSSSLSSSSASSKTRWVAQVESRPRAVQPSNDEHQKATQARSSHVQEQLVDDRWRKQPSETPKRHSKHTIYEYGKDSIPEHISDKTKSLRLETNLFQDESSSRKERAARRPLAALYAQRNSTNHEGIVHQPRRHDHPSASEGLLPYPVDDQNTLVSMPSPRPHCSASVMAADEEREYCYVKRTTYPQDSQRRRKDEHDQWYKETKEYVHRRHVPAKASRIKSQPLSPMKMPERQPSVTSSRVRFSDKVDVSPTPPGSDASSVQFRSFYNTTGQLDRQDGDYQANTAMWDEVRGRARSREPMAKHDGYYKAASVHSRRNSTQTVDEGDRDRTPRPVHKHREAFNNKSTSPSNLERWTRVHSESPSREKLRAEAAKHGLDAFGPYTIDTLQSASMNVEDGSAVSGSSISARHEAGARQGRDGGW